MKKEIVKLVEDSIRKLQEEEWSDFEIPEIKVERPEQKRHGDYASNVALLINDEVDEEPMKVAKEIASAIDNKEIEKVEAAEPGFINIFLKDSYFQEQLVNILKEDYGKSETGEGKKVVVEYGQPNTHKLPHVGHFRSYVLGESLARLMEFNGYDVFRANYQGDVGLHVSKCLWAYQEKEFKEQDELDDNVKQLQEAYQYGSRQYEEDEKAQEEIEELNNKIQRRDDEIVELWEKTRQWSVDYYDKLQKQLGIEYNQLYFESETGEKGKEIVGDNLGDVFEKSEGAVIFPGSEYDLHDRVFITSDGNPTYEAKDLALAFMKKEDFDYDISIISTASEQIEYFKVVYKALAQIEPELAEKFVHVPFGLISLKGGELSSRKGNIVSIKELMEQVEQSLAELIKEKESNPDQKTMDKLVTGACKYSLLRNTPIKDMVFDLKESIDLEGNSGPYLQYTNVRALSILKGEEVDQFDQSLLKKELELELLKKLSQFPEVTNKAAQDYKPNLICNYLFDLAQKFNSFYEEVPVLKADKEMKKSRLALVEAVSRTLGKGLNLLGIETLREM